MINKSDVIRLRIPFPDIDSELAVNTHMYVCMENSNDKKFIKCQTFKAKHLYDDKEPFQYVVENADISRNPFNRKTIIDCDKMFYINGVLIPEDLLTTSRRDVCGELFSEIESSSLHEDLSNHQLDNEQIIQLNWKITALN